MRGKKVPHVIVIKSETRRTKSDLILLLKMPGMACGSQKESQRKSQEPLNSVVKKESGDFLAP